MFCRYFLSTLIYNGIIESSTLCILAHLLLLINCNIKLISNLVFSSLIFICLLHQATIKFHLPRFSNPAHAYNVQLKMRRNSTKDNKLCCYTTLHSILILTRKRKAVFLLLCGKHIKYCIIIF